MTILVALAFGAWSLSEAPEIEHGMATPWIGVKERIFWYGYQSWFLVLALRLLTSPGRSNDETSRNNTVVSFAGR
jgi:hypothetical protein